MSILTKKSKPPSRFSTLRRNPQIDFLNLETSRDQIEAISSSEWLRLTWERLRVTPTTNWSRKSPALDSDTKSPQRRRNPRFRREKGKWDLSRETLFFSLNTRDRVATPSAPRGMTPYHTGSLGRPGSRVETHLFISFNRKGLWYRAHDSLINPRCGWSNFLGFWQVLQLLPISSLCSWHRIQWYYWRSISKMTSIHQPLRMMKLH